MYRCATFSTVAENILAVDSPVGKSQQNLLEMFSQPSNATPCVAEPVMRDPSVIKGQVAFDILGVEPLRRNLNRFYILSLIGVLPAR